MTEPRTRILVFQPLIPVGSNFDYRMLGFAHWITDQLGEIGLEGVSAVFTVPDTDGPSPMKLVGSQPPTDAMIRDTLVENASRFGLMTSFTTLGGEPRLAVARLFEVRRGHPLRTMARWTFDGDTQAFPVAAHGLFVLVAQRLGAKFHPHDWTALFETKDVVVASNFLTALGCYATCDRGIVLDDPVSALRAAMSGVVAGMPPAINFFPHLIAALRDSGSADRNMLRDAMEQACEVVGVVPESWTQVRRELGLATGVIN
jgi:hypothetical protein